MANPKFAARVREAFPDAADQILGLILGTIDPSTVPSVKAWIDRCYHPPSRSELVMAAIDVAIDGCGVEAIWSEASCTQPYAFGRTMKRPARSQIADQACIGRTARGSMPAAMSLTRMACAASR